MSNKTTSKNQAKTEHIPISDADLSGYLRYARIGIESSVFETYATTQNFDEIAVILNLTPLQVYNAFRRVKAKAALQGFAPDHDMRHTVPDTHFVKGTSTLYRDGQPLLQWVKSDKRAENLEKITREIIEALKDELPKVKPVPAGKKFSTNCLAVYPMGDPHLGLLADKDDTGDEDFNIKIAERDLCAAVDRLVDSAPACEEALIVNLGDFFHADNMEGRTARSGHKLDTDSRWSKVLRVGLTAIRQCITSALKKHKRLSVINAIGNHDDHSSMFLSVALAHIYENEPRVNIIDNPTIKHYYRFGKNLIGVHHGHTIKPDQLPLQMATDRPADWAATTNRMWLCGHIHHIQVKEFNGVTVENFRTLAAKDAWHASMGYHAGKDMCCILLHKDFGEVERHKVSVAMLHAKN